jgi:hypothetical protein
VVVVALTVTHPHQGDSSRSWSREGAKNGDFLAADEVLNADMSVKSGSYIFLK